MTKPTAFEKAAEIYRIDKCGGSKLLYYQRALAEWFFNAGRQAEMDALADEINRQAYIDEIVPPEDTKREQEEA